MYKLYVLFLIFGSVFTVLGFFIAGIVEGYRDYKDKEKYIEEHKAKQGSDNYAG